MEIENRLAFDPVKVCLQSRIDELFSVVEKLQKALGRAPEGRLRVSMCNGKPHFYHVTKNSGTNGEYIPSDYGALVKRLAQKDYDSRILAQLQLQIALLEGLLAEYHPESVLEVYGKLPEFRRDLVRTVFLTDEEFVRQWQAVVFRHKAFDRGEPTLVTARGERVRSKSEVIIADTLNRLDIPYRYEYPLRMAADMGTINVYPDFTCLNVRTRQEYVWEHFGMIDNPQYACNLVRKLQTYRQNGIYVGDRLIVSEETSTMPLNSTDVELLAKRFLL